MALEHRTTLDIYNEPHKVRKTGIVCTIGPKTNDVDVLVSLVHKGMSIVRLNFSHGNHKYHSTVIANARAAAAKIPGCVLGIALDTKGPEIRTGTLKDDADIKLEVGSELTLTSDPARKEDGDVDTVFVDYVNLPKVIKVGQHVYMDDGLISLEVTELGENFVKTKVVNSGMLGSHKGVNLPNVNVDLPAVSEKDKSDLLFGVEQNVDIVFASFIRKASDVRDVRAVLGEKGKHIKIISKIENHEGVKNFDEILEESDGIMVARGDLGIEIAAQKVFLAQKMMISKCNIAAKPVICATQMLESMTVNPRPTRAEVSDVANAVLDGSDCVMLSGETAKGKYPREAVAMMAEICREAETAIFYGDLFNQLRAMTPTPLSVSESVACAAVNAASENKAAAIVVLTITGTSARLVAKYRPMCPILVVTRNGHTARCAHLSRGLHPIHYDHKKEEGAWQSDVDKRIDAAMSFGKGNDMLSTGDIVVAIQGWQGGAGNTNTIRMLSVP
eukprot:CAMPEP_0114621342 /NCGR_PEP_ID=MMETSP0168-20121206/9181_1 /TAXON_ID=95228 ORGANISM="Vannella sp., Strain DIVA3 517/6/12" /NCGR_SAMPLE_ID=MMETSP0168 /ASSEMBLY_ACC=CAM_ASM_000044 /LENGTH=501 /DNA_ID=CAMNT_0001832541 /DNA_START=35 /DNA_END=1540 /DNA_ORIENTATION=+